MKGIPIPGTGKRRWHFGNYYKNQKTTSEKRMSAIMIAEGLGYLIRAKRSLSNLPNPWDDIVQGNYGIKNWKRFKKRRHAKKPPWKDVYYELVLF